MPLLKDNSLTNATMLWGRLAYASKRIRLSALAFVICAIISMSFSQLGFWGIGTIDDKPLYLVPLLAPLFIGAFMFGPLTGALLGFFTGAVVVVHSILLPLDYYELYFMTPMNSFCMLTFLGFLAGYVFKQILHSRLTVPSRIIRIVLASLALSLAASLFVQLNSFITYNSIANLESEERFLVGTPSNVALQALLDAVFIAPLCVLTDIVIHYAYGRGENRKLLSVFSSQMLFVSSIVFMLTSAFLFSMVSMQSEMSEREDMLSEVVYLAKQLDLREPEYYGTLLDGYETDVDGLVAITDSNSMVLASTDLEILGEGSSLNDLFNNTQLNEDSTEGINFLSDTVTRNDGFTTVQRIDDEGNPTIGIEYLASARFHNGYTIMVRPSEMVFKNRAITMASITLLALLLIAAIALIAARLLNQVVVQRIDETNDSLEKITGGDLGERVRIQDSREFASLSKGINTTVAALRDSIIEAEHKNAQELLTAKAIQESSLPREFPPFPDIDRFDIYASMKMAKEVGGDFYDFFLIDETKLGFLIADVSGKGIPASLFMMTAKTQIRNYMEASLPIDEAVNAANHQLCLGNDAGMFVTMFACILDYETGELTYVNAGHNPPLLFSEGTWTWMRDVSGMPLGLFDGMPYKMLTYQMQTGEMLYLYTDGVTEAMDSEHNLFGEERLEETLYKYASMNPRSVGVGVRRSITDFTLDCEQSDDITMLIMKYGVPPEKRAVMILQSLDSQLIHVTNFIHEELKRRNAPKSVYNPLDIAAEELFVNVCHYAYPKATSDNPGEVRIGFEYEANPPSLTVMISDDGIPYNPLEKPDAVTPDNIADVPIGGLGILMAKQSVDEMHYKRIDGSNVVTFSKGW